MFSIYTDQKKTRAHFLQVAPLRFSFSSWCANVANIRAVTNTSSTFHFLETKHWNEAKRFSFPCFFLLICTHMSMNRYSLQKEGRFLKMRISTWCSGFGGLVFQNPGYHTYLKAKFFVLAPNSARDDVVQRHDEEQGKHIFNHAITPLPTLFSSPYCLFRQTWSLWSWSYKFWSELSKAARKKSTRIMRSQFGSLSFSVCVCYFCLPNSPLPNCPITFPFCFGFLSRLEPDAYFYYRIGNEPEPEPEPELRIE